MESFSKLHDMNMSCVKNRSFGSCKNRTHVHTKSEWVIKGNALGVWLSVHVTLRSRSPQQARSRPQPRPKLLPQHRAQPRRHSASRLQSLYSAVRLVSLSQPRSTRRQSTPDAFSFRLGHITGAMPSRSLSSCRDAQWHYTILQYYNSYLRYYFTKLNYSRCSSRASANQVRIART